MRILLAGVNGYIGTQLIPVLLEKGHEVICLVRDKFRFREQTIFGDKVKTITADLLKPESISPFQPDIDVAYYLVQSVLLQPEFEKLEAYAAHNFVEALSHTHCRQIIYLSDVINDEDPYRNPPASRYVENMLKESDIPLTVLRTAIIIGQGSLLLQLIHKLTETTSLLVAPQWLNMPCQPVALTDVLAYLEGVALNEQTYNQTFDVCGPDILTFRQLLLSYARLHHLKQHIITIPFFPAGLSVYWLKFLTNIHYALAKKLVTLMRHTVICYNTGLDNIIPRTCLSYKQALIA